MKKKWETPRMYIEEFAPNEYVSSCLYLECAIPGQDPFKGNDGQIPKRVFDFEIGLWGEIAGIRPDYQEHYRCGGRGTTTYCTETNRGFWWTDGKIDRSVTVSDFQMGGTNPADWNKPCAAWKTTDQNGNVYQHYGYAFAAEWTLPNRS